VSGPGGRLVALVGLCREAGAAAMAHYDEPAAETKADGSPLTRADLASNRVLVAGLPAIEAVPVLSEESKQVPHAERAAWDRFWLVDPIDGTREFLKRNGEFTVNVALVDGTRPLLGAVHAPALGVTYLGEVGVGAWVDRGEGPQPIRAAGDPEGPLRVVASRSHRGPELEAFLAGLGDHEALTMGSSLKLCLVAEGRAHLYPRTGPTMEWDTAAAHAVAVAAGCRVIDLAGRTLRYNKPDLHNPWFVVMGVAEGGDVDRRLAEAARLLG